MRGIRLWLLSAALLGALMGAAAQGRPPAPGGSSEPQIAAALPGGTVVGSTQIPVAAVTVMNSEPVAAMPPAAPAAGLPIVPPPVGHVAPVPGGPPACAAPFPAENCCGPIGAHGPIGQEIYVRIGASFPIGDEALPRNLNIGWATQIGGRSQFFNTTGDAAWAIDAHLAFTYNNAGGRDIVTLGGEPVIIRDLHRWAVGVGFGRDMFLSAPGFVAGTWDANFRLGWDIGGRWGSGHVNATPLFEPDGYRRKHDVFAQSFAGVMATMEMPVGAYTALGGVRVEWDYTFSDLMPKGASFHEVMTFVIMGVRY